MEVLIWWYKWNLIRLDKIGRKQSVISIDVIGKMSSHEGIAKNYIMEVKQKIKENLADL